MHGKISYLESRADTGGGSKGLKNISIPRSRYSNRAVTVLEQWVVSYVMILCTLSAINAWLVRWAAIVSWL